MSFNFYPERVEPIGQKAGTIGENLLIPIQGMDGMRITIPQLSVSCGADAQVLTLRQVETQDAIVALDIDAKTVAVEDTETDLTDRLIALETKDGGWIFLAVSASVAKIHTFTGDISEVKVDGRFLIIAEENSELNQRVPLEAGAETLIADDSPGRLIACDFCYPVILSISNETSAVQFNGATVIYISR
ncbi:hypothetical protein EXM22_01950 [Oceanispirochaeta crateris]|uniref:Uncharacterized protein n=1 Tax=Oceanispirochaeta crateris TaxID=2518645 RepID=A0A5C1QFB9_9SPIO|nr:hypothetical protein [Oceanispirochaeta crateris]QEN06813.1 hypothetical protein EXM22_01950 [Oceanispirochaeta crateris]